MAAQGEIRLKVGTTVDSAPLKGLKSDILDTGRAAEQAARAHERSGRLVDDAYQVLGRRIEEVRAKQNQLAADAGRSGQLVGAPFKAAADSALGAMGPMGGFLRQVGQIGPAGAAAGAAVGVLAVGFAVLVHAVGEGVKEIHEMEMATAKLEAVFQGNAAAVGRMGALIKSLDQAQPFFEDDQLAQGVAGLRLFEATEAEIKQLMPVLTDMAAVMGTGVEDAVQKVGLALAGNTRSLKQWGIVVAEGSTRQEILNAVLEKAGRFHESAGKLAETMAGKEAQLSKEIKNLEAAIAEKAMPMMLGFKRLQLEMISVANDLAGALFGVAQATGGLEGRGAKITIPGLKNPAVQELIRQGLEGPDDLGGGPMISEAARKAAETQEQAAREAERKAAAAKDAPGRTSAHQEFEAAKEAARKHRDEARTAGVEALTAERTYGREVVAARDILNVKLAAIDKQAHDERLRREKEEAGKREAELQRQARAAEAFAKQETAWVKAAREAGKGDIKQYVTGTPGFAVMDMGAQLAAVETARAIVQERIAKAEAFVGPRTPNQNVNLSRERGKLDELDSQRGALKVKREEERVRLAKDVERDLARIGKTGLEVRTAEADDEWTKAKKTFAEGSKELEDAHKLHQSRLTEIDKDGARDRQEEAGRMAGAAVELGGAIIKGDLGAGVNAGGTLAKGAGLLDKGVSVEPLTALISIWSANAAESNRMKNDSLDRASNIVNLADARLRRGDVSRGVLAGTAGERDRVSTLKTELAAMVQSRKDLDDRLGLFGKILPPPDADGQKRENLKKELEAATKNLDAAILMKAAIEDFHQNLRQRTEDLTFNREIKDLRKEAQKARDTGNVGLADELDRKVETKMADRDFRKEAENVGADLAKTKNVQRKDEVTQIAGDIAEAFAKGASMEDVKKLYGSAFESFSEFDDATLKFLQKLGGEQGKNLGDIATKEGDKRLPPGSTPQTPSYNVILNTKDFAAAFLEMGVLMRPNMSPTSRMGNPRGATPAGRAPATAAG